MDKTEERNEIAEALSAVIGDLASAKGEYERCEVMYRDISHQRTNAINRLNDAQKKFDAAIADMKKSAPRDSDWNRQKGRLHEQ